MTKKTNTRQNAESDGLLQAWEDACHDVENTPLNATQKMGSLLLRMSVKYYQDVRRQAQQSFYSALAAAIISLPFFIYAATLLLRPDGRSRASISLISGALIQVISGINFYLYGRAAKQFAGFHICLERTNRFLLANSLCENLSTNPKKDEMRMELIRIVANAPMLTLDIMGGGEQKSILEFEKETVEVGAHQKLQTVAEENHI